LAVDVLLQRRKPAILAQYILTIALLPGVCVLPWLVNHYEKTRPKEAAEQSGNIYPLNDHGRVVYLTRAEQNWIWVARVLLAGPGLWVLALAFLSGRNPPAKEPPKRIDMLR
jgi:hypothetical protein